eukprot:TRINITY_DN26440_c0_g1_i1.p1 TRINITY_DN26440_c0_g1~~TRINITY_DN26440_c0_g1_i1.p1  ORF type:complete len:188 (-),score=34.75 TRINITY_DN26440_c0_g1_i1:527-1090(-)
MPDFALCCERDCLCVSCCCQLCALCPHRAPTPEHVKRTARSKAPTDWQFYSSVCLSCCVCPCWLVAFPVVWVVALLVDLLYWAFFLLSCYCCFQCKPKMRGPSIRYHTSHKKYSCLGIELTCCHSEEHRFGRWEDIRWGQLCSQAYGLRHPLFGYSGPIGKDEALKTYPASDPFVCWCFNCCCLRHH